MRSSKSLRKKSEIAPNRRLGTQSTAGPICQYNHARTNSNAPRATRKCQPRNRAGSALFKAPTSEAGEVITSGSKFSERQLNHNSSPAIFRMKSMTVMGTWSVERQASSVRNVLHVHLFTFHASRSTFSFL